MKTIGTRLLTLFVCGALTVHAQDSRLGTYHAEPAIDGAASTALEVNRLTVTISEARANSVSTITKLLPYDVGPPAVGVFESGSCVLVDGFHGTLEFYDPSGSLLRTVSPLKDALPELERVMPFAMHDFSVTVAVSQPGLPGIRLFRYTERGDVAFSAELSGQFPTGVVVSHSGTFAAVGSAWWNGGVLENATFLVSESGVVENALPVACSFGAFSPDDSLLLVAAKDECALISVAGGTFRSRAPAGAGRMILDAAPKDGGFVVISATDPVLRDRRWHYEGLRVERMETDGTVLTVPGNFQQAFGSAHLKIVEGQVLLQIDGVLQPVW